MISGNGTEFPKCVISLGDMAMEVNGESGTKGA
jgi:hypothetical protein